MPSGVLSCLAVCTSFDLCIPWLRIGAPREIFKALPYVVTIVVLVITSLRKKREYQPPQSLGLPYFREEL